MNDDVNGWKFFFFVEKIAPQGKAIKLQARKCF